MGEGDDKMSEEIKTCKRTGKPDNSGGEDEPDALSVTGNRKAWHSGI